MPRRYLPTLPASSKFTLAKQVIRKTTKTRGCFPTDDAETKLIYLAIHNFEKAGRCVREWVAARNQFAILYPERLNK